MTRRDIIKGARATIADCLSSRDAIRAGLLISACKVMPGNIASAQGCIRAASDIADMLDKLYQDSATLSQRLSGHVTRRDWLGLWLAARREVYPAIAS